MRAIEALLPVVPAATSVTPTTATTPELSIAPVLSSRRIT